jgi:pentatricopeptide repeat protein
MDSKDFEHLAELRNSGRIEDQIRESLIHLAESTDANEKASLLGGVIVSCCMLGRLEEARQMLGRMQELDITDLEVRLNAEFCEPCLLIQEDKQEEGLSAFAAMLQRNSETLRDDRFRYLYEDIQCRRAFALIDLSRFKDALPILREAVSFSFDEVTDDQKTHFWLGVCLEETNDTGAATQEFVRVVSFGLRNDLEERARYRVALLYFKARAFAQARMHLEMILRDYPDGGVVSRKHVYEQLSHTCRHLGDSEYERLYMDLAKRA